MTASEKHHTFPCTYCDRLFKRLEHAQRHERTHTKETPYKVLLMRKSVSPTVSLPALTRSGC